MRAEGFNEAPSDSIRKGVGYGAKAMLHHALVASKQHADAGMMIRLAEGLIAHYEQHIAIKTQLFPGFLETAHNLRKDGVRIALCTNKLDRLVDKLLPALGIDKLFDARAGRDTFAFHKPDPRHITELVSRAGGSLAFAMMVGDSEADIEAARGAGIPVLAVRFGYSSVPAEKLGADAVLDRFEDIPRLINAYLPVDRRSEGCI